MKKIASLITTLFLIFLLSACTTNIGAKIIFEDGFGNVIFTIAKEPNEDISGIDIVIPTKEGYSYIGWDLEVPKVMPKTTLTIKALWDVNSYIINFNVNGAFPLEEITATYDKKLGTLPTPLKYGFDFLGWYLDENFTELVTGESKNLVSSGEITLHAKWYDREDNVSTNLEVNAVYYVLEMVYYKDLNIDLTEITELEELFEYLDPYTYLYISGSTNLEADESYVGLGVTVTQVEEGLLVTGINLYSQIDEYLYVGDLISSVDGTLLSEVPYENRIPLILGEVGTIRTLGIKRMGAYLEFDYDLREINNESLSYELIDDIGYIYIERFGSDTKAKFNTALSDLESANINELIIDVRDNGGGYLTTVVGVLEHFVTDSDPYLTMQEVKLGKEDKYRPKVTTKKPYNISVLVNENSASASEVLAEVLKQEGYQVYGVLTYGKDVFQAGYRMDLMFPNLFPEGTVLNATLGYWLPHNRVRVEHGVTPTVTLEQTGVLSYYYPVLEDVYQLGDENIFIETFQYLVSLEVDYQDVKKEFDESFENALKLYQAKFSLDETGELDLVTQMLLIDQYRVLIKSKSADNQLMDLINILNN